MKQFLYYFLIEIGLNIKLFLKSIKRLPFFINDYRIYRKLRVNSDFNKFTIRPILHDKFENAGSMMGHYFHQDLLIARKIYENKPQKHIDIGSRIDGFVAQVSIFRKIEIFDIRPLNSSVSNIVFKQADLMQLDENLINYCDSISSLHAIEHFGLGRYGDPIDMDGHKKALINISKILKSGGVFYFSTPIGSQRIEFNAHRVFDVQYLLNILKTDYELKSFSYVNDVGNLYEDVLIDDQNIQNNFGCEYGCAIFELIKK